MVSYFQSPSTSASFGFVFFSLPNSFFFAGKNRFGESDANFPLYILIRPYEASASFFFNLNIAGFFLFSSRKALFSISPFAISLRFSVIWTTTPRRVRRYNAATPNSFGLFLPLTSSTFAFSLLRVPFSELCFIPLTLGPAYLLFEFRWKILRPRRRSWPRS